jgi:hypothetical protein
LLFVTAAVPADPELPPSPASASEAAVVDCTATGVAQQLECADAYTLDHGDGDVTVCSWRGDEDEEDNDDFVRVSTDGDEILVQCDYGPRCGWQDAGLNAE